MSQHTENIIEITELEGRVRRAYRQRANLAVAFAKMAAAQGWPYGRGLDGKTQNDMEWRHVLYVDLPGGEQVSYHFAPGDLDLLDGLPIYRGEWDGKYTGTGDWHELLSVSKQKKDFVLEPGECIEQAAALNLSGFAYKRWRVEHARLKADKDVSGEDRDRILTGYIKAWSR